ncbi:hypothetical protein TNCV_657001 [Trichonephila clavipes]|nr:hypothetical protein TNCV_657001 [Trichonephila clavipes]
MNTQRHIDDGMSKMVSHRQIRGWPITSADGYRAQYNVQCRLQFWKQFQNTESISKTLGQGLPRTKIKMWWYIRRTTCLNASEIDARDGTFSQPSKRSTPRNYTSFQQLLEAN